LEEAHLKEADWDLNGDNKCASTRNTCFSGERGGGGGILDCM
jgi:hypothetical protein